MNKLIMYSSRTLQSKDTERQHILCKESYTSRTNYESISDPSPTNTNMSIFKNNSISEYMKKVFEHLKIMN